MNIGIIVYSKTGNTLSVAKTVQQRLMKSGHTAVIAPVLPANEPNNPKEKIEFKSKPEIAGYDALIFASPVHAFSLAPVMKAYLSQLYGLSGKKVGCFMTQQFPYTWMGGNQALRQMAAACKGAGGNVTATGIVNWSSKKKEEQIEKTAAAMTSF